ncbi:MAG: rane-bound metal-dependent hydrolase [Frankiales bacterium]|nr:rane-bound metal-dependent hydrolase [Frankiales bacterium]
MPGAVRLIGRVRRTAPVLLLLVLLLDLVVALVDPPLWLLGLLDEPAHLATAGLVLLAAGVVDSRALLVLAGSVGIDADHVPLYLGVPHVEAAGGRPLTHSLLTLAVLLLLGLRWPALRWLAAGVALHLLRDVATGPGLPLLWPADVVVLLPYALYAAVLAGLTAVALRRRDPVAIPSAP